MGHDAAREHVNYVTATTEFPLKCTTCHGGRRHENFLTGFFTEDYVSPFNLAVSPDGQYLYTVGQEDSTLHIVNVSDPSDRKSLEVGQFPHSVVLDEEARFAYVSNQWSDNVMKIRVPEGEIVDRYRVGAGPSGLESFYR